MLSHEKLGPRDLTGLAVCIGPGSYSGLRIGVAVAKGMALPLNLPVVGLSTLEILAAGQPPNTANMIAVAQAGRGWIITEMYHWQDRRWQSQGEAQRMTWEALIASLNGPVVITGEIDQRGHDALADALAQGAPLTVNPAAFRLRRAGFLAEEAWARLLKDNKNSYQASQLVPIYIPSKDVPVER